MTGPAPSVPRKFHLATTDRAADRAAAREAVGRALAWPVEGLVMAHGAPMMADGGGALGKAFGWLVPSATRDAGEPSDRRDGPGS